MPVANDGNSLRVARAHQVAAMRSHAEKIRRTILVKPPLFPWTASDRLQTASGKVQAGLATPQALRAPA